MSYNETKNQLKNKLTDYVQRITEKSKGTNMYICPLCRSGTGKNHSGAFSIKDNTKWKCFKCSKGGDIFDLIGEYEKIPSHTEQFRRASEIYGIEIANQTKNHKHSKLEHQNQKINELSTKLENFNDFFLQAHKHICETDYPAQRGLSKEIINRFKLGYISNWKHPKAPNSMASPRLIIPISEHSYIARDTRNEIPKEQEYYKKSKVKGLDKVSWIFNKEALKNARKPIIVVEGEIDALSVMEVGGEAISLGSVSNVKSFIELLKVEKTNIPLIISLDNDKAGEKASEELRYAFKMLKIPFYGVNIAKGYKDPNDALKRNREHFKRVIEHAGTILQKIDKAKKEIYLQNNSANYLQKFINGITNDVNTPFIPTGFKKLDYVLDGGIYEGLYIIGAISSLGKTTMILQIADQIAKLGQDILIFSLEMARTELIAKSISRHTLQRVLLNGDNIACAKTTREITTAIKYNNYTSEEKKIIHESITEYGKYAEHIFIDEGIGDIGVQKIRDKVEQHIYFTGNTPIVIIDYLQILEPYNERATDKQNIDKSIRELKRLSRDFKIPVVGISSFNRENYKNSVTMEAFKESGAIEYSSDILIGLQLKGSGNKDFKVDEAKRKNPREIELVILKNRNGSTGNKVLFNFYPLYNYFKEL